MGAEPPRRSVGRPVTTVRASTSSASDRAPRWPKSAAAPRTAASIQAERWADAEASAGTPAQSQPAKPVHQAVAVVVAQQQGAKFARIDGHVRSLGSIASRNQSPRRLKPSTVTVMASPGKVVTHQARSM